MWKLQFPFVKVLPRSGFLCVYIIQIFLKATLYLSLPPILYILNFKPKGEMKKKIMIPVNQ